MARYCTRDELARYGIRAEALRGISTDEQDSAIDAASDEMDGYLASRYELPLASWESDVRIHCARLAVYTLIVVRGFNPGRAGDEQLRLQREDAIAWLVRVSNGSVVPRVTDASSGATEGTVSGGVHVSSNESRGYSSRSSYGRLPFQGGRR